MPLGGQRSSRKGTEPMESLYPSWVIQRQLRASWMVLNAYRRQSESRLYTGIQLQTGTPHTTKMYLQVGAKHPLSSMDSWEPLLSSSGQHLHLIPWAAPQLLLTLDKTCTDCKHGHPVHTANTWSQWSESGAKFHPKVRWDDYQHVDLSFTYLTIGKWAQLHIARTVSVVGSFIVKAKRQIPSETDSVKCLFLDKTNHNFLYPPKHKGTCSTSFNTGCSWLIQPCTHIAIGFISFSCHLPIFSFVFSFLVTYKP